LEKKTAKAMLETLAADPETFVFKNNGIMVVAESIEVQGNEVQLTCMEPELDEETLGHGILNGGHTHLALKHALSHPQQFKDAAEKAIVTVAVAMGIPEEEIWLISKARNLSEPVPLYALRELAGDWNILKEYLPSKSRSLVAFKPNDPEAPDAEYDATDLVRRLALINNKMFPAEEGKHPVAAYSSIGSLTKKYDQKEFISLAKLLPDVLRLEELVVRQWEERNGQPGRGSGKLAVVPKLSGCSGEPTTLLSGYRASITLADPFVLPVVAAFRVFVKAGNWYQAMEGLWKKYGPKTVEGLYEAYRDQGRSSATFFARSKSSWAAACDLTKAIALQEGLIKVV
jgi:hypothetical protein